jgi:hypothetical protein
LRLKFISDVAHMWGVKYRNGKLREYLKLDELNGLRRHHIKYQYDSFITEAVARLALGRRFSQATSDMKQSMKKDIVVILKLFFEKFTASPWMDVKSDTYSPIPTNLNKFLRRCCQIWLCDREGAPFLITQNDFLRIQCFYRYVAKYILPLYKLSWDNFSELEARPPAPFNGRPDLLLADFESRLLHDR